MIFLPTSAKRYLKMNPNASCSIDLLGNTSPSPERNTRKVKDKGKGEDTMYKKSLEND
jgi:hypothetical protein